MKEISNFFFFLNLRAELENNYRIIQELRQKIDTLNKTKIQNSAIQPIETIQFASSSYHSSNKTGNDLFYYNIKAFYSKIYLKIFINC